jgi:uncharacterized iron-regulated protein
VRAAALLAGAALLAACAGVALKEAHPLEGRIWDVRAAAFVTPETLWQRAARARHVILGETHDNPEHHRLQHRALEALAQRGPGRLLAMEQFDAEHQSALDAARAQGADAERLADAGRFDRKGWNWPLYRPLVEFAVRRGWPLVAANLSRADARAIVSEPSRASLPPASPAVREALERDLIDGHCGHRPDALRLAGLVEAQRARDARMAQALASSRAAASVLVAGSGHARKDVGAPAYLASRDVVSIAFLEVDAERPQPPDYLREFATAESFDYLWFTSRHARPDPCAALLKR